jgi:hypothetical protein
MRSDGTPTPFRDSAAVTSRLARASSSIPGCAGLVKPDFRFRVKLRGGEYCGDRGGSRRVPTIRRGVEAKVNRLCDHLTGRRKD